MKDKVQKILSEIATRKLCTMDEHMAFYNDTAKEEYRFLSEIEELIKALQEEPVSEELEEAAVEYSGKESHPLNNAFKAGAKWQAEQMMANAVDGAFIRRNRYTKKNVLNGLDMTCDAIQCFKDKDKIKVLFIKED